MPATLLRRSLEERSVTEDAGKRIQDWVASRSPNAIFAITPMGYPGPLAYGQVYPPHHHHQQQQGALVARPGSVGTVESGWSEWTRVGDEGVGKKGEEDKATTFAAVEEQHNQNQLFLPQQPPPPPSPQPATSSTPVSFVAPATVPIKPSGHVSTPSISQSITTSNDLPLPGTPRSSVLNPLSSAASVGESAFSTPKTTPSPAAGARPSHKRGASSGAFTPMPLALSTAASTRSLSASSTLSGPEPPKVELKRTWSIGTWIPQLKEGGGASEARKEGGDEEEKVGLVGRG
ncbi:hypothetical protein JCM10450v2_000983 [Rhodotorula kratochvilovae]